MDTHLDRLVVPVLDIIPRCPGHERLVLAREVAAAAAQAPVRLGIHPQGWRLWGQGVWGG